MSSSSAKFKLNFAAIGIFREGAARVSYDGRRNASVFNFKDVDISVGRLRAAVCDRLPDSGTFQNAGIANIVRDRALETVHDWR